MFLSSQLFFHIFFHFNIKSSQHTQPQIATLSLSMKPILMNSLKTHKKISQLRVINCEACKMHKDLLIAVTISDAEWHFLCVCLCTHGIISTPETSLIQFYGAFLWNKELEAVYLSRSCIDLSKLLLAFLTWLLLSDLPPHRFPDVCRLHALTCRLGNRFLFRQSWQRWCSQCWPGRSTSSHGRGNLLFDCRVQHICKRWHTL